MLYLPALLLEPVPKLQVGFSPSGNSDANTKDPQPQTAALSAKPPQPALDSSL